MTTVPGSTFDAPPPGIQDRIIAELHELRERNVADLAVTAGSDAEVRLGKRAIEGDEDAGVIRLHYTDAAVFADELAAYGPEVRVLSPASLRTAVRDRLGTVAAAHRRVDGGGRLMAKRPKPLKASDKLVFLLSFVPYLLEQRVVDVPDAAAHFGMTEEEIRDAVRLIATSGLPGATGTYQPNDLFDIDWDSFEDDDVIVIVHHVAIDDAPTTLGTRGCRAHRRPAVPVGVARERGERVARLAHGQAHGGCLSRAEPARRSPRPRRMRRSPASARPSPEGGSSSSTTATPSASRVAAGWIRSGSSRRTPTGTCRRTATLAKTCGTSASTE